MLDLVEIGKIARPHGYKGALFIKTDCGKDSALAYLTTLYIGKTEHSISQHTVIESAWMPKGWKLELSGITSDTMVKSLKSYCIFAAREDLAPVAQNEFYVHDLLGASVIDATSETVFGRVSSIDSMSAGSSPIAQDRWWIESKGQVFSIPATSKYIDRVDLSQKTVWLKNLADIFFVE